MEPAKIDWKRIESVFVEDKLYENINAPKWFDLFSIDQDSIHDEAWFCRPDCNHPKTAEDFLKRITPTSKLSSSADKSKTSLSDKNQRDGNLKRRVLSQSSFTSCHQTATFNEDSENQNPNLSTPVNQQVKSLKEMIKSSSEKNKPIGDMQQANEAPRLKSTLSARNLFAGKDILSHITDFCSEMKKMATRARERENDDKLKQKGSLLAEKKDGVSVDEGSREVLGELNVKEKERKPLLERDGEKSEGNGQGSVREKQRRNKRVDAENIPVPLNLASVKNKAEERLLQIRTNPPSPQCFSAKRAPTKTTPSKASRSRPTDRGILQELKQEREMGKEESEDKGRNFSIVDGRESSSRAMDVFWFLKPCTLSS